ncbi:MAG: HAMP domain-containing histidine kinase [Methylibium sp.]|uniref:sensor histidine kinase n=1 Tax=Methylibium sp. TaxID=2067992 RepID=UPI001805CC01|nr:HAMP domain-containing sensor histidine kinase [Methylibium sp.]MBA3596920.1 HAMP domain-containing histidine kinase [Methylibium sp.]
MPRTTLGEFIVSNMETILEEWERYAAGIPEAAGMDTQTLRDHAEQILQTIARDMALPQSTEQQEAKSKGHGPRLGKGDTPAEEHAGGRQREGFGLIDLVSEYRALRASVLRLWAEEVTSADQDAVDEMTRFNEAIDQPLSESVGRYSAQLDRSRELFLGVLGHDLRNPLSAVLNAAQYLQNTIDLTAGQSKSVAVILRSGLRLRSMVSDLLDVTRTRLGQSLPIDRKQVNLNTMCQEMVEEAQAHHPEHTLRWRATGELSGSWDAARLGQMLSNLVENAIRHGAQDKPVTVSADGEAEVVTLCVHNEGIPIPEPALRRIFEPLTQEEESPADHLQAGGLGLGLYIARAIAEAHGGSIEVQSLQDAGTTFTARLPRKNPSGEGGRSSGTSLQ